MAVTELYIAEEIRSRISAEALEQVAANLHQRDCQTCGEPIGAQRPALSIDDVGSFLAAMINHPDCQPSGWYELNAMVAAPHLSWTSRFFTVSIGTEGAVDPRAAFVVCPHLEVVHLDQAGGGGRTVNTERHWRARGFRPMGRELMVGRWVADQAPPVARLMGSTVYIDAGIDGQWSSSARLETIKACRRHGGLLVGVSTVFDPAAATGVKDFLEYGAAGHIFLGWVPLS